MYDDTTGLRQINLPDPAAVEAAGRGQSEGGGVVVAHAPVYAWQWQIRPSASSAEAAAAARADGWDGNGTRAPRQRCTRQGKHATRAHAALPSRSDPRAQERSAVRGSCCCCRRPCSERDPFVSFPRRVAEGAEPGGRSRRCCCCRRWPATPRGRRPCLAPLRTSTG